MNSRKDYNRQDTTFVCSQYNRRGVTLPDTESILFCYQCKEKNNVGIRFGNEFQSLYGSLLT
jgi:hypothetical protein